MLRYEKRCKAGNLVAILGLFGRFHGAHNFSQANSKIGMKIVDIMYCTCQYDCRGFKSFCELSCHRERGR